MKLHQIEYFVAVCQHENHITHAAETLHVSQPAISSAILALEKELGAPLFERTGRRLILTELGEIFFRECQEILRSTHVLKYGMQRHISRHQKLEVGVDSLISTFFITKILPLVERQCPDLTVNCYEIPRNDLLETLEAGIIEMAILNKDTIRSNPAGNRAAFIPMKMQERFAFFTYPEHPLATQQSVLWREITDTPLALLRTSSHDMAPAFHPFEKRGLKPQILAYFNQTDTISSLLAGQKVSSVLSDFTWMSFPRIVRIPIRDAEESPLGMAVSGSATLKSNLASLIRFLKTIRPDDQSLS